jgi:hypothetical protein
MPEEPSIAVIVERVDNVKAVVDDIKLTMSTKSDQQHTDQAIVDLTAALAQERTERMASVKVVADRLQLVEDRQESRKYSTLAAGLVGAIALVVGVLQFIINTRGLG